MARSDAISVLLEMALGGIVPKMTKDWGIVVLARVSSGRL
jgi:hypothetical protein